MTIIKIEDYDLKQSKIHFMNPIQIAILRQISNVSFVQVTTQDIFVRVEEYQDVKEYLYILPHNVYVTLCHFFHGKSIEPFSFKLLEKKEITLPKWNNILETFFS